MTQSTKDDFQLYYQGEDEGMHWGHSGKRKEVMVIDICRQYCTDGGCRRGAKRNAKEIRKIFKENQIAAGSRAWYECFVDYMKELGFRRSESDYCLYVK